MTAVRVLNPVMLSEICKIGTAPAAVERNLPCYRQLQRIKRNLFGPTNAAETTKIFAEELEKHQVKAIKKWGFDFRAGLPLSSANSQYIWERVSFQESICAPEVYALTRAAHVRPVAALPTSLELLLDERAEREMYMSNTSASTDTDSCDETPGDEARAVFKAPAVAEHCTNEAASSAKSPQRKRQPKITEYMKERKRLAQTPKKVTPPKRMRTSSGSNSLNVSPSISAHFSVRNIPRNK